MSIYATFGAILAAFLYFPLWWHIKGGNAKQNMLTWILWLCLDVIAVASLIRQKGNFPLVLVYVIGSLVAIILIHKFGEKPRWGRFQTFVLALVVVCVTLWLTSGDRMATVASSLAVVIAGLPQLSDTWTEPKKAPIAIYCGSLAANLLTVLGGKEWSVAERFYSSCVTIFCACLILIACRKYFASYKAEELALAVGGSG